MAAASVPGHKVPEGVDPRKAESITEWVKSFGNDDMVTQKYDEMLVDAGYENLYSIDFDVEDLEALSDANGDPVEKPRARRMVRAATAVMMQLGVGATPKKVAQQLAIGSSEGGGGGGGTTSVKDRGEPEPIPQAPGSMQVVAGLGTRAAMALWVAGLVIWVATWDEAMSVAILSLRRDPMQSLTVLEASISEENNKWLASKLWKLFSEETKALLGAEMALRSSALEMLQWVFLPFFEVSETNAELVLDMWEDLPPCGSKAGLMQWLAMLDDLVGELKGVGEVVSDRQKLVKIKKSCDKLKEV